MVLAGPEVENIRMTLAAKISMCLALWLPPEGLHVESQDLLSYWYNQQTELVRQAIDGEELHMKGYLPWDEFVYMFSLPNSDYLRIPECIQSQTEES